MYQESDHFLLLSKLSVSRAVVLNVGEHQYFLEGWLQQVPGSCVPIASLLQKASRGGGIQVIDVDFIPGTTFENVPN